MRKTHASAGIRDRNARTLSLEALERRAVPAVVAWPGKLFVREGETRQVSFRLNSLPTADVTFTLQSSNTAEATIDKTSLTFTPANWRTPQVVSISAVEDLVKDGNNRVKIVTSVSSSTDPKYASKCVRDVTSNIIDSKKVQLFGSALYDGNYSGSFGGTGAWGSIAFSIQGNWISGQIRMTRPGTPFKDFQGFGSGTLAADGSLVFRLGGPLHGTVYTGRMSEDQGGQVSAFGNWNWGRNYSGTWEVNRRS